MVSLRAVLLFMTVVCGALGVKEIIPGPVITSSTSSPSPNTSTSTPSPPTTQPPTPKPTTVSTTPKPTTAPPTPKPTTPSPPTTSTPKTTTTTSKPPTTPAPTPVDPVGKWNVNYTNSNRTCLVLEGAFNISVYYQSGNVTKNSTVTVPSTATSVGQCGDKVENITLKMDVGDVIKFNFKKSEDGKRYDIDSVLVMLNVSTGNDSMIFTLAHNGSEFSTPLSNSYKCAKEQKLNLTAQAEVKNYTGLLHFSHFQIQAFRNSTDAKFSQAVDCASSETPDAVPIAVGCSLAALVVVVLVTYLIGRRRSQARGYLSM